MANHRTPDQPRRIALYARVSTEDQAERGTIQGQLDFLRSYVGLYGLSVVHEYIDDGWSGTTPLSQRPDGRQLLADATAGAFDEVLVYRLDRLGRSLRTLLEAHGALEAAGVTIRSATEPFDTGTPIGRFLFQLLGSLAELERSTISERMNMGRDRVARAGKWTGGPVPFGYDLDADGCLIPSGRLVDGTGLTEAEIARSIIERIADGSSTVAECRRLNTLGVPTHRRYASGTTVTVGEIWLPSRINAMVRSTTYKGSHTLKSKGGPIERTVPALVDAATWDRAQAQLVRNRALSTRNAKHQYLLRGLITCAACGVRYAGTINTRGKAGTWVGHYYRCGSQLGALHPDPARRCRGKRLPATWLEDAVWQECRAFILNPGDALAEAQRQLQERLRRSTEVDAECRRLQQVLAGKEAERERVMTLYRRGRATLDDTEAQLDAIQREAADLRATIDALRAQQDLTQAFEAQYADARALLGRLRDNLEEIERANDWQAKRQIVELLVAGLQVATTGTGRDSEATVTITYRFTPPGAIDTTTARPADSRDKGTGSSGRAYPRRG